MIKGFFACPMRGDRERLPIYRRIVTILGEEGVELVSKHQTQENIISKENELDVIEIHDRDYNWLKESKLVVAEITRGSSGVGAEVADAVYLGIPVLGIYDKSYEGSVSAYVRGKIQKHGRLFAYTNVEDIRPVVREFVKNHIER